MTRDDNTMSGKMIRLPSVDEIGIPVKEQLIVELYSSNSFIWFLIQSG